MVQPTKPPVSIRISDELIASVAAWAEKRKITRNAAYAQLLEAGLRANGPGLPTPERQAEMKRAVMAAQEAKRVAALNAASRVGRAPLQIQVGPVERKAGELLKKPKKP